MFVVNSFVEAVDADGRWETARVADVSDSRFLVSFVGWSRRFDRWVDQDHIRPQRTESSVEGIFSKLFLDLSTGNV